ncbi:MAG TPA: nitroreductase family protein [Acidimicrobiales bacterium]|nr:nitroreductase family protein [Acidimicrobiales bacterium]
MEFQEVVRRRRMVRAYADRPLPEGMLDRMLDNALHAPSAGFTQGWAFLVLEGREQTEAFWSATFPSAEARDEFGRPELFDAPAIIVALSHKQAYLDRYAEPDKGVFDKSEAFWTAPYWDIDTGFAALLMLLTAVDEGLGALFFGLPVERVDAFRSAFGVPDAYTPIGAITVGWPAPDRPSPSLARGRRGPSDVVHRGRW